MSLQDPPTYDQATSSQSNQQQAASGRQTLVLDGCKIYSSEDLPKILYELSSAPYEAIASTYDLHKVRYRLSSADGEGDVRNRLDHIYSFKEKSTFSLRELRQVVVIDGKTSRKRTYKEVVLSSGTTGWASCGADGHFSAKIPLTERFKSVNQIVWKNNDGNVVGFETRPKMNQDGSLEEPAQLSVEVPLEAKDLDLLVACWMARLWGESKAKLQEQRSSSNCKCFCKFVKSVRELELIANNMNAVKNFTSLSHRQRNVAKLGGSTGAASASVFF